MKTIRGVMHYLNLEGGFWVVRTNDGEQLTVHKLAEEFCVENLAVELTGTQEAVYGITMAGDTFTVSSARRL